MKIVIKEKKGKHLSKKINDQMRKYVIEKGYDIPKYIVKDYIRFTSYEGKKSFTDDMKKHLDWLGSIKRWENEVLDIEFSDLSVDTQNQILERGFGTIYSSDIFKDKERMEYQKSNLVGDGKNEPVFFVYYGEGLELQEGWHRIMTLFSRLPKDDNNLPIGKIKVNSWIGYYT